MTRFERDELYRKASKNRAIEPLGDENVEGIEDFEGTEDDVRMNWSATQKQVWEREKTYWELTAAGDVERFVALWDDRFVGWPDAEETPVTRSELRPVVADWFEDVRSNELSYALDPLAVAASGNVAIAYYRARTEYRGKNAEQTTEYRMTHVWRKTEDEWKIVGGTSAPITDEPSPVAEYDGTASSSHRL